MYCNSCQSLCIFISHACLSPSSSSFHRRFGQLSAFQGKITPSEGSQFLSDSADFPHNLDETRYFHYVTWQKTNGTTCLGGMDFSPYLSLILWEISMETSWNIHHIHQTSRPNLWICGRISRSSNTLVVATQHRQRPSRTYMELLEQQKPSYFPHYTGFALYRES